MQGILVSAAVLQVSSCMHAVLARETLLSFWPERIHPRLFDFYYEKSPQNRRN